MSAERYTQEQILSGIRIFWRERLNRESLFDPDRSIIEQLKEQFDAVFEDGHFSYMLYGLDRLFGLTCPTKEWESVLGIRIEWRRVGILFLEDLREWEKNVAPRLTFRVLAEFIRERLTPISLEPITLMGKPCLTAGLFRGLEKLAIEVNPKVRRFAPSTPIRRCLRGLRLRRFWGRLRWMFEDQLPPPPKIEMSDRGCLHSLIFKFGIGTAIALWRKDLIGLIAGLGTTIALIFPLAVILGMIEERLNPLPKGIETFGDLARLLAAIISDQQSEAASCSTP